MALMALAGASFGLSALSAYGKYQEGQTAHTVAMRQQQLLAQQSKYVQQQAGLKITQEDYNAEQLIGRLKVGAVSSGVQPGVGSPAMVTDLSAQQQRINDMYTKYSANVESANIATEGELIKARGEEEEKAADISAITGLISGGIGAYGIGSGAAGGVGASALALASGTP